MSATDDLRRLLDERGVGWTNPVQIENSVFTRWHDANNTQWTASEIAHGNGKLRIGASSITPEQAIAATLGDEPKSMRVFDSMETALTIAEKEVEIEKLEHENAELCDENEELAHRRAELERSLEHYRLEVVCYESDVDARDALICDMARELRDLKDGGISTDCMEYERRMRELGIEVD